MRTEPAGDFDYERVGTVYSSRRRADPRIAALIHGALGDACTVLNVGAGAGSYEPEDRQVRGGRAVGRDAGPTAAAPPHRRSMRQPSRCRSTTTSFDAAMATVTVHQWSDHVTGLRELRRVSPRPGGDPHLRRRRTRPVLARRLRPRADRRRARPIPVDRRIAAILGCADRGARRSRSRSTAPTASPKRSTRGPRSCSTRMCAARAVGVGIRRSRDRSAVRRAPTRGSRPRRMGRPLRSAASTAVPSPVPFGSSRSCRRVPRES